MKFVRRCTIKKIKVFSERENKIAVRTNSIVFYIRGNTYTMVAEKYENCEQKDDVSARKGRQKRYRIF